MRSLLTFPKPLVALANGPGIGLGLSLLPHCDLVLAARGAWFQAPFTRLGIVPEAGSSFLFPPAVGRARVLYETNGLLYIRFRLYCIYCTARSVYIFFQVNTMTLCSIHSIRFL